MRWRARKEAICVSHRACAVHGLLDCRTSKKEKPRTSQLAQNIFHLSCLLLFSSIQQLVSSVHSILEADRPHRFAGRQSALKRVLV